MKILGLHTMIHDTGASTIIDGKINSIVEARISRVKHSGEFPYNSIRYVMDINGIKEINEFDIIAVDHLFRNNKPITERKIRDLGYYKEIQFIDHHDAHAASAFFCSSFDDAAVLIVDGQGSSAHESSHDRKALNNHNLDPKAHELQSYYYGSGNKLYLIRRTLSSGKYHHGIGDFYSTVTKYLNFGTDAGKVMGLAPYGGHNKWSGEIYIKNIKGDFYLNTTNWAGKTNELADLFFNGHKPRTNEPVMDEFWTDVAYVAQNNCEYAVIEMANYLYRVTKCKNICLAGGVALNSVANKKILDETPFENIYIQPAASDEGISLGAALYAYHQIGGKELFYEMRHAFLGKDYQDDDIKKALQKYEELIQVQQSNDVCRDTAKLLENQKVVGWFQGASEFGPRALGNRSILCDARSSEMKDYINAEVKHRESFRPYAPSIIFEESENFFDLNCESPFMLLVADVKEQMRKKVPAITHVNGTARVQTVRKEQNSKYYELLLAYYERTGIPLILNTSFNVAGEPIVESPEDAVNSLLNMKIDVLVMSDYLITRRK